LFENFESPSGDARCPSGDVSGIFLAAICRWSKPSHLVKVNHSGEVDPSQ
jgi:hypothetical protein